MIKLQRILVPTDFSENSHVALQYAREFAEAFSAALHVLHVLVEWLPEGCLAFTPKEYNRIKQETEVQLRAVLKDTEIEKYRAQVVMRSGRSEHAEIIEYARQNRIDLIIMGAHGPGAISRMLLGGVVEKVIRTAPCPVLTARLPER